MSHDTKGSDWRCFESSDGIVRFVNQMNGDVWNGTFESGRLSGEGTYVYKDSGTQITGNIAPGPTEACAFQGHAIIKWQNGDRYSGIVEDSVQVKGSYWFKNQGVFYNGGWKVSCKDNASANRSGVIQKHGKGTNWVQKNLECGPHYRKRACLRSMTGEFVNGQEDGYFVCRDYVVRGQGTLLPFNLHDMESEEELIAQVESKLEVIRTFEGRYVAGYPTTGSLSFHGKHYNRVVFDGKTPFYMHPIWYWEAEDAECEDDAKLIDLDESEDEYFMVKSKFKYVTSNGFEIKSIQRLMHKGRRECYEIQARMARKKISSRPEGALDYNMRNHSDRWAFHAPGFDSRNRVPGYHGIIKEGYRATFSGLSNGCKFGRGNYFAIGDFTGCMRAHEYAKKTAELSFTKNHCVFLNRIAVGCYKVGSMDNNFVHYDPQGSDGELFDSFVDNLRDPSIFVIPENTRAYPAYLITYAKIQKPSGGQEVVQRKELPVGRAFAPPVQVPVGRGSVPPPQAPVGRGLVPPTQVPVGRGSVPPPQAPVGRGSVPLPQVPVGRGFAPPVQVPVGRGSMPLPQAPVGRGSVPLPQVPKNRQFLQPQHHPPLRHVPSGVRDVGVGVASQSTSSGTMPGFAKKRLAPEEFIFGLPLHENTVVSNSTQQHLKKQKRRQEASTKTSSAPRKDVIDLVDDSD